MRMVGYDLLFYSMSSFDLRYPSSMRSFSACGTLLSFVHRQSAQAAGCGFRRLHSRVSEEPHSPMEFGFELIGTVVPLRPTG
jgi:hypothetical protein